MSTENLNFTPIIINGTRRPASDDGTFQVVTSYNKCVGTAACATSQDCSDAIDAASQALSTWEQSPLHVRRQIFLNAAELVKEERYKSRVLDAMTEETSATREWGMFNWAPSELYLKSVASLTAALKSESQPSITGGQIMIQRRPMGVLYVSLRSLTLSSFSHCIALSLLRGMPPSISHSEEFASLSSAATR
jgi:acyl-CoA reductase-like NAD-dependent aldehyde dehydrogenase